MAHYAFLDKNNVVVQVIVGNDEVDGSNDLEKAYSELSGYTCKRTSYNTKANTHALGGVPFRKNYAGIGFTYDPDLDAFIPPRPGPESQWSLDAETCTWKKVSP